MFRESIEMGTYEGTSRQLDSIIDELRTEFSSSAYNILTKNCNHFADALVRRLVNKQIPYFVNRLAYVGSIFSCILPPSITGQAPVNDPNSIGNNSSFHNYQPLSSNSTSNPLAPSQDIFKVSKGMKLGISILIDYYYSLSLSLYIYIYIYIYGCYKCSNSWLCCICRYDFIPTSK